MGWIDWLRYVLAPLLIAAISAAVATRNARKTPHERLKNLVDIHDKMKPGLDHDNVVETAIARELVHFDRRLAADQRGFWAGLRERAAQLPAATLAGAGVLGVVAILITLGLTLSSPSDEQSSASWWTAISTVLGAALSLLGVGVTAVSTRSARTEGRDEQLVATVAVQLKSGLNQRLARMLASGSTVVTKVNHEAQTFINLLKSRGLIEAVAGSTPGSVTYKATPRGVQILRRAVVHDETDGPDEKPPTS